MRRASGRPARGATGLPDGVSLRPYRLEDRGWVEAEHIGHYTTVEGFGPQFAAAVRGALDALEACRDARESCFLVCEAEGAPVGCLFLSAEGAGAGRLRLFYLDAGFRGQGVGREMLGRAVAHASEVGLHRLRVSTYDRHADACRLYRAAGFSGVTHEAAPAFGLSLCQVDFELSLSGGVA